MMSLPASYDWLFWGVGLLLGMPILVIALGELSQALARGRHAAYMPPLDLARGSCLFLLFLVILLRRVAGLPGDHIAVKTLDTAFWITVINAVLVLVNVIFFGTGANDWRAKLPKLMIDLGRLFLVAVGGALVVSHVWGVDLRGLLAALGVGSLVIGLALQDTLGNVFSGLAMISARQFQVGDWIRIGDVEGQVRSINWRTVSVATLTGDIVVIPNSQIARDRLRVYGADQGWLRIACELKLAYEHPPELVQKVLLKAVAATKGALAEPQPNVRLVSFEDFAVLYRVSFCIKDFRATVPIRSDFFANFWYIAERHGIVFPARYNHRFDLPADITRPRIVAPDAIADRLRNLGTFQRPIDALADLAARARVELFRKGETVLAHNQRGDSAYVVAAGSAQALDVRDGREEMIDAFAAGDLILYKSFFRGGGAPYLVRATADLEVIAIPFQEVEAALSRDMLLAQEVERLLTLREEGNARARAKSNGSTNGAADDADRVQILRDLFRV